jgi:hypothetical protein
LTILEHGNNLGCQNYTVSIAAVVCGSEKLRRLLGHKLRSGEGTRAGRIEEARLKETSMEETERSSRFMLERRLVMAPLISVRIC